MTPRCKVCYEKLECYRIKDDEWEWWCETCHERNPEHLEEEETQ